VWLHLAVEVAEKVGEFGSPAGCGEVPPRSPRPTVVGSPYPPIRASVSSGPRVGLTTALVRPLLDACPACPSPTSPTLGAAQPRTQPPAVDGPVRVTNPLLDVLAVLLAAFEDDRREMHGWAIMKATARSGPTVYGVLDRLEDAHLITGRWEDHHPQLNRR
jgi:hypothetical protein